VNNSQLWQAFTFVRVVLLDRMWGIRGTTWYRWRNIEDLPFAMLNQDKSFRPVYFAYQFLSTILDGFEYNSRIDINATDDYLLLFRHGLNKVLVVWTSPSDGQAKPTIPTPHFVDIVMGDETRTLDVFDVFGNQSSVEMKGGAISLEINAGPQYIILPPETSPTNAPSLPSNPNTPIAPTGSTPVSPTAPNVIPSNGVKMVTEDISFLLFLLFSLLLLCESIAF